MLPDVFRHFHVPALSARRPAPARWTAAPRLLREVLALLPSGHYHLPRA
jgi:hypothetical protein